MGWRILDVRPDDPDLMSLAEGSLPVGRRPPGRLRSGVGTNARERAGPPRLSISGRHTRRVKPLLPIGICWWAGPGKRHVHPRTL